MLLALLFVTLPFVVRAVQPVLMELDRGGGGGRGVARRHATAQVFTQDHAARTSRPAILAGVGLAFARAVGEFGSVVLISGNIPFDTQVAPVFIFCQVESRQHHRRRRRWPWCCWPISFVVLLRISSAASRWRRRHDR